MKKIITILIMVGFTTGLAVSFGGYVFAGDPLPGLDITIVQNPGGMVSNSSYSSSLSSKSTAQIRTEVSEILSRYNVSDADIDKVTAALEGSGVYKAELKSFLVKIRVNDAGITELLDKLDELGAGFIKPDDQDKAISTPEEVVSTPDTGDISTPAVDSFFDVFTEVSLEVFIEVIANDANLTKTEAGRVIDTLMAVSPAFTIDKDGLQEKMNRAELVEAISSGAGLTKANAERALDAFVGATTKSAPALHKALITGERVASVGSGSFYIGSAEVFSKTITKVKWANIVLERAIDEGGIQRIEAVLNDEINAADDYEFARSNTIARIKEAGITDEAKITEILDALYEPIRVADATYDAIDRAMVDFPFLGRVFGNERMNVYIDDQAPFNIITSGGKVESLNPGEIENPTMRCYTNMVIVDQLTAGTLPPPDAFQQGKIDCKGVGFINSIKVGVLKFVSGLLSKFM